MQKNSNFLFHSILFVLLFSSLLSSLQASTFKEFNNADTIKSWTNYCIAIHVNDEILNQVFNRTSKDIIYNQTDHIQVIRSVGFLPWDKNVMEVSMQPPKTDRGTREIIIKISDLEDHVGNQYITRKTTMLEIKDFPHIIISSRDKVVYGHDGREIVRLPRYFISEIKHEDNINGTIQHVSSGKDFGVKYDVEALIECYRRVQY